MASLQERVKSAQGDVFLVAVYPSVTASSGFDSGVLAHLTGLYAGITYSTVTEVTAISSLRPLWRSGCRRR